MNFAHPKTRRHLWKSHPGFPYCNALSHL